MTRLLRKLFGVDSVGEYALKTMTRTNLDVVGYEALFIAIVSTIVAISTSFPTPPWTDKSTETIMVYRAGFVAMIIVSIVTRAVTLELRDSKNRSTLAPLAMLLFIVAIMGISMWLTLFDFAANRSLLIYLSALVLLFGIIYLPPLVTFLVVSICTTIMIVALSFSGYSGFVYSATLIAYAFLAVVVASTGYHARLRATLANEEIHNISIRDELTGVKNRRALETEAESFVGSGVFVLLGDIDEFKFYNDSFGHAAGDSMLRRFATCMTQAFGADHVYRYGGDEFVAVMRGAQEEQFLQAVDSWRKSFVDVELDGEVYSPTTSGGYVGGTPASADEFHDMLRLADLRLYDAKQAGRNTVLGAVYDEWNKSKLASSAQLMHRHRSDSSDPLTGLPSLTYFYTHAKTVVGSPKLEDVDFSIVYFNIENMKNYNERFGMAAGDELLQFVASTVEDSFEHALVARSGDDRFVLLTYGDDLMEGIERVYSEVLNHNTDSRTVIRTGIYPYDRQVEISTACDRAKLACDHIKGHYNVSYYFYDQNLKDERDLKQFILDRFDEALETGAIQVYYQPIMRTIGTRISDMEALARWIDPTDGFISPADFVPVLEEFRLINRLDLHILELICSNYQRYTQLGKTMVPTNINLSHYDLELCDIVSEVVAIMERYDVPPHMINIEITENAFSEKSDLLRSAIEQFHKHGMQVWMDDFGSGYSSLNLLREYGFDAIKIDLGFLQHRDDVSRQKAHIMLPYIIGMAKDLMIQTLAEGVETMEQYEFLRDAGCGKVQGYAFARPMPIEQLVDFVESGSSEPETRSRCCYYDIVSSVNLLTMAAMDEDISHSMELSSGLPSAIVQFCKGKASYLAWNSSYLDYLRDIRMYTIENSVAQMNDMSRPQSQGFHAAAANMRGKPDWLKLTFYEGEDLCTGMARCLAVDEEADACAFVYVAFNVSSFLHEAGYSIPKEHSA